jgi:hypothetical protein
MPTKWIGGGDGTIGLGIIQALFSYNYPDLQGKCQDRKKWQICPCPRSEGMWVWGGIAPLILNLDVDKCSSRSCRFTPGMTKVPVE